MHKLDQRILYFPPDDLAYSHYANVSLELLFSLDFNELTSSNQELSLEQVICLSEAAHYIQDSIDLQWLEQTYVAKARTTLAQVKRIVGSKLGELTIERFEQEITSLSVRYRSRLTPVLVQYNAPIVKDAAVVLLLKKSGFHLQDLLQPRKFVELQDKALTTFFASFPRAAEILLEVELCVPSSASRLTIPKGVDSHAKQSLIEEYATSENANPSYLKLITNAPNAANSWISPNTRYLAHKRHKQMVTALFEKSSGIKASVEVVFDPAAEKIVQAGDSSKGLSLHISTAYLLDSLDDASILNNFVYIFGFTNVDGTLRWPSTASEYTLIERIQLRSDSEYPDTFLFSLKRDFYLLALMGYSNFLRTQKIDLEAVIARFFNTYLPEEFGVDNFSFIPTRPDLLTRIRTRELLSQLENIFRQFTQLCQNGEIDPSLTPFYDDPINFSEVPSLLPHKSAKPTDLGRAIVDALFSDQSLLNCLDEERSADSFIELISEYPINIAEYDEQQQKTIRYLEKQRILEIALDGIITPSSSAEIATLQCIWIQGEVHRHAPTNKRMSTTADLIKRSILADSNGFFTKPEADFYNFILNRTFTNGPNIRNKYAHGNEGLIGQEEQLEDYYYVLMLVLGVVIKINDELEIQSRLLPSD